MVRTTIDFGIHLGVRNSRIAVWNGTGVEVFKNDEGWEYTPSAVWFDRQNRLHVGRRAKERFFDDDENTACEFMLLIGTAEEKLFARSGRRMKPEDLTAWVLKELKAIVRRHSGEEPTAAVITVPADFELPACKATEQAARLAGFACSPLLQEPVAAALAYRCQGDDDQPSWLVYHLGGGAFDVAVIHMRNGQFQVLNHGGDRNLGGNMLDWEIVNQFLVPAVIKDWHLVDFRPQNRMWTSAFAKLKLAAKEAKIVVSTEDSAEIANPFLCNDDRGQPVRLKLVLRRPDVERIAEPFIFRSINICKKVLAEKRLAQQDVQKVLLVGGPTLMPYLRERLADTKDGLGIPLDFSIDPPTAIVRGAAVFAGTCRLETAAPPPHMLAEQYRVQVDYQSVSPTPEPVVEGRVEAPEGHSLTGFTILASAGSPVLIHSVGLALPTNETAVLLSKGTPLPACSHLCLRTVKDVLPGQPGHILHIPVVEGEHGCADRNRLVGSLEIASDWINRNLPAGSEIELTVEMDDSRLVRFSAYVPYLDQELKTVFSIRNAAGPRNWPVDRKENEDS